MNVADILNNEGFEAHYLPNFVTVGRGRIALYHRPKVRFLHALKAADCTHVLTLLSEREGACTIGEAAEKAGMTWLWLALANGNPPSRALAGEVRVMLSRVRLVLANGGSVLIHCSAGVHRTGMIGYALLRLEGFAPDAARETLRALRPVTAAGVGEARLAWGDRFAADPAPSQRSEGQSM
jgi:protein-tyrosine phosphatase